MPQGRKVYQLVLVRAMSKNQTPYWKADNVKLLDIANHIGDHRISFELDTLNEDQQVVQLNVRPAWSEKLQKVEVETRDGYKNSSFPIWENRRKDEPKDTAHRWYSSQNYSVLEIANSCGTDVNIRLFITKQRKSEKSPVARISVSPISPARSRRTKAASTTKEEEPAF